MSATSGSLGSSSVARPSNFGSSNEDMSVGGVGNGIGTLVGLGQHIHGLPSFAAPLGVSMPGSSHPATVATSFGSAPGIIAAPGTTQTSAAALGSVYPAQLFTTTSTVPTMAGPSISHTSHTQPISSATTQTLPGNSALDTTAAAAAAAGLAVSAGAQPTLSFMQTQLLPSPGSLLQLAIPGQLAPPPTGMIPPPGAIANHSHLQPPLSAITLTNSVSTSVPTPTGSSASAGASGSSKRESETEEQKRRRLEKSKIHSRETRRRNKAKMQYLEERVAVLEAENDFLRMQVARLEEELATKNSDNPSQRSDKMHSTSTASSGLADASTVGEKRSFDRAVSQSSSSRNNNSDESEDEEGRVLSHVSREEAEKWSEVPSPASQAVAAAAAASSSGTNSSGRSYNLISFTQARCSQLLSRVDALLADNNPKHMSKFVDEYIDQVAVYGRSRQAAITYCLNQILSLLHLNSDTRFIFWAAMQRKAWQNRRNGIFKMFIESIQLSEGQIQELVAVSDRVHDILLDWRRTGELFLTVHSTLKETSERVHNLIRKELLPLLTPKQVILYLRWIEMNPAVNEMIKTLVPAFDLPPLNSSKTGAENDEGPAEELAGIDVMRRMPSVAVNKNALLASAGATPTSLPPTSIASSGSKDAADASRQLQAQDQLKSDILATSGTRAFNTDKLEPTNVQPTPELPAYLRSFAGSPQASTLAQAAATLPPGTGIADAYNALIEHTDPAAAAATQRMIRAAAAATSHEVSQLGDYYDDDDEDDDGSESDDN